MKTSTLLLVMLLMGTFLYGQGKSPKFKQDEVKILSVLEKYIIANETQNIDLIEEIWAIDEPILAFGTEVGEKIEGWEELRSVYLRQFNNFSETYISARDQKININDTGNSAWFSQILNYNFTLEGISRKYEGIRFTGVLIKKGEQWRLVQIHLSLPYDM